MRGEESEAVTRERRTGEVDARSRAKGWHVVELFHWRADIAKCPQITSAEVSGRAVLLDIIGIVEDEF